MRLMFSLWPSRELMKRWLSAPRFTYFAPVGLIVVFGALMIALSASKARGYTHLLLLSLTLTENAVALLFRRRHPVGALAGVLIVYAIFNFQLTSLLPTMLALLNVAMLRSGRTLAIATVATALVMIARPCVQGDLLTYADQSLLAVLAVASSAALGMYLRTRQRIAFVPAEGERSVPEHV